LCTAVSTVLICCFTIPVFIHTLVVTQQPYGDKSICACSAADRGVLYIVAAVSAAKFRSSPRASISKRLQPAACSVYRFSDA